MDERFDTLTRVQTRNIRALLVVSVGEHCGRQGVNLDFRAAEDHEPFRFAESAQDIRDGIDRRNRQAVEPLCPVRGRVASGERIAR